MNMEFIVLFCQEHSERNLGACRFKSCNTDFLKLRGPPYNFCRNIITMPAISLLSLVAWERANQILKKIPVWNHAAQDQPLLLRTLPVQIIQNICDLLPPASAASFTITNKRLYNIIEGQPLILLGKQEQAAEKESFLRNLQRDLLHWQLFYTCMKFHPADTETGPRVLYRYCKEPWCAQVAGAIYFTAFFTMRFQDAQLVMNHYRAGVPYADLRKKLCHSYRCYRQKTPSLSLIKTSIVGDNLMIHVTSPLRIRISWSVREMESSLPNICRHNPRWPDQLLMKIVLCHLEHRGGEPCDRCSGWKSCEHCQTSFRVSAQGFDSFDLRLSLDIRRLLGWCKTPFDPDWWEHCDLFAAVEQRKPRARPRIH